METVSPDDILAYISECGTPQTKRDLARAFRIKGDARIPFKRTLRELEKRGSLIKQPSGGYAIPDTLPAVTVIEVTDVTVDGDVIARPAQGTDEEFEHRIEVLPPKKGHPAMGIGDRALARLNRIGQGVYEARIIRSLDAPQNRTMGLVCHTRKGYILQPTNKKTKNDFDIIPTELNGAQDGDLVVAEVQPQRGVRRKTVRILEIIGKEDDPKAVSLIALHEVGLRTEFTTKVIDETRGMEVPSLKDRVDLRSIPLVTIDGADARDFDDAVFAEETGDGFHLIVAIADVSYYVQPGTALDQEAYARGNSTYFPDRVLPMLPEALSNDLCSLRPKEDRACMAMHLWIDKTGQLKRYKIERGIMRSLARLTYEQVQAAQDGMRDDTTDTLMEDVITPLYKAYEILDKARSERGALDLDLPERQVLINEKGEMTGVKKRQRLDAHKLIEEFMILANVAAAKALEDKLAPCMYRVHEPPKPEKLDSARQFLQGFGLSLAAGQSIRPTQLNQILTKAAEMPHSHLISEVILRTQSQAHYSPDNAGHFGLALTRYAHFTSPIRRYADLLVHRALVNAYNLGPGGLSKEEKVKFSEMADHISNTERKSMEAERSAVDRFTAAFLATKMNAEFDGRISGVTRFGLFITLDETGADGLVPIRTLPEDYYIHNEEQHALIGRKSGRIYRMGASIRIMIVEADPLTGSTLFGLTDDKGADIPGFKLDTHRSRPQRDNRKKKFPKKGKFKGRRKN